VNGLLTIRAADYTLNNPDTLTKYKTAAQISQKVLESVTGNSRTYHLIQWLADLGENDRMVSGREQDH
jgi:methionine aminopeptidase